MHSPWSRSREAALPPPPCYLVASSLGPHSGPPKRPRRVCACVLIAALLNRLT